MTEEEKKILITKADAAVSFYTGLREYTSAHLTIMQLRGSEIAIPKTNEKIGSLSYLISFIQELKEKVVNDTIEPIECGTLSNIWKRIEDIENATIFRIFKK